MNTINIGGEKTDRKFAFSERIRYICGNKTGNDLYVQHTELVVALVDSRGQ